MVLTKFDVQRESATGAAWPGWSGLRAGIDGNVGLSCEEDAGDEDEEDDAPAHGLERRSDSLSGALAKDEHQSQQDQPPAHAPASTARMMGFQRAFCQA